METKEKSKSEFEWIKEIIDRYDEAEKLQPPLAGLAEDWPAWASKLLLMLMRVSHPGLKLKHGQKWTAKDLGAFLGRQCALDSALAGEVPLNPKIYQELDQALAKLNPSPGVIETALRHDKEMEEWRPHFKRFIEQTLTSARNRPYPEMSAFFEAFGKASVIKPDDLLTEQRMGVSEKIAWTMFMLWPVVSKLESVAQLHKILAGAAKPIGIAIEYRRVEKLCQRIGLKFKGPGRPKKKTQTKSKSS